MQQERFEMVERFTASMLSKKLVIFSPIVYAHAMSVKFKLPGEAAYWLAFNMEFLRRATSLWVLDLPGWEVSRGVQIEISTAEALHIPIRHFHVELLG
jgi:hypothetical protein